MGQSPHNFESRIGLTVGSSVPCHLCRFESRLVAKSQRERRERRECTQSSRSKSIPIQMNRQDMLEDLEIREQEMIADERDYCMFHRIVNGMIARHSASNSSTIRSYHSETEKSIANILRTRYKKIEPDTQKPDDDSDVLAGPPSDSDQVCSPCSPSTDNNDGQQPPETIFVMDM